MKLTYLLTLLFGVLSFVGVAQTDFNDYRTLQASGEIPSDFTAETFEKVAEELQTRRSEFATQTDKREFLESSRYAIDDLLHSGMVIYGDEVSNYVEEIAAKLLKDQPELKSKLRFYTLKLNATNAFSTDQGIIFVTTGLISQLANEAQLAFVLAHEISHYTEHHVVEEFTWKKKTEFQSDWIDKMSVYSQDKEFDADLLGVDLYRKAGYSQAELLTSFDVLLYSYLPFDEIDISLDYFSTSKLFLPSSLFPTKEYPINADENADDSESSHPNIRKRKEAVQFKITEGGEVWGTDVNPLGEDRFTNVRNIARFESVRSDVMDANYGSALYSIYLLELQFPESIFLQRMKAQAWLGVYQYEKESRISQTILDSKDYEGFSSKVHYMLKKHNSKSLRTVAIRHIYDIYQKQSDDFEIQMVYTFLMNELATDDQFDIMDYSEMTFSEYVAKVEQNIVEAEAEKAKVISDTLDQTQPNPPAEDITGSKYDRIKKTKGSMTVDETTSITVDSSSYYIYGLSDIRLDSVFRDRLLSAKNKIREKEEAANIESKELTFAEKSRRYDETYDDLKIGSQNIIVVEPTVVSYTIKKGIDRVKSEIFEGRFAEAIHFAAEEVGININSVDSRSINTLSYNERSVLYGYLGQLVEDDDIKPFPVDYVLMKEITEHYNTSEVMFTMVDHTFQPQVNKLVVILSMFLFPTLPITVTAYIPAKIMAGNQTNLSILIMDVNTAELKMAGSFYFNEKLTKINMAARMYTIFKHLILSN